jgi:hypothetical protein
MLSHSDGSLLRKQQLVVVDTSRHASAYSVESIETLRHVSAYLVESIEIELTAEGLVLGLVKVEGHSLLDKLVCAVPFECGTVSNPRHNGIQTIGN